MAHKKGQGSSRNGRDSNAQRLGVKMSDGQSILSGGIITDKEVLKYILDEMLKEEMMILCLQPHLA